MRKDFINAVSLMVAPVLFAGCVSLAEKTGRVLDGSAFAEQTVAVYRTANTAPASAVAATKAAATKVAVELRELQNKAGGRSVGITLDRFPFMTLRGSAPDAKGGFYLTSLEYLSGTVAGWNEYAMDISGSGALALGETKAVLRISDAPQAAEIARGRIHRYDTRITGSEALTSLRNRRERIAALAGWMNSREDAPTGLERNAFERYWKPILLPEMVGVYRRPKGWELRADRWVRAEDIRWNTGYTERVFPEELREVRNSGTLLRDWEEAPGWIYLAYEWERIGELLSREHTLQRIK
jgi:hypothetical protein